MPATKTLVIEGDRIHDITSFYDEVNRVFILGEDWTLGPSLDALDDLLHGGYGAIAGKEPVTLHWRGFEKNRGDLGIEATRGWHQARLAQPERYNVARITRELADLESGEGRTYFDIVLEIIAAHPNIRLVAG